MKQKSSTLKLLVMAVLLVTGVMAWNVAAPGEAASAAASLAACTPTGTTYGTDTFSAPSNPVVIPASGANDQYNIWVRAEVPSVSSTSPMLLNLNNATGTNCYAAPASAFTTAYTSTQSAWVWVNVTAGLTAPTLAAGNQTLVVTGTQSGARLDSIEFLSDPSCNPNTTNCTVPTDTTAPTVSLSAPANNTTVSGTTTITASASDDSGTVSKVEFYNGTTLLGTDTSSPYTYSWDTSTTTNGSHTLTAKAYDPSGNVGTSSAITVTVGNAAKCAASTSTTLAAPTGLTQNQSATTYTSIGLSWTAPTPTPGCTISSYNIFRGGSKVGSSTTTTYTDTGLTAGTPYTYAIQAVDSGPNTSGQSATASFTTTADNMAPTAPTALSATAANASQVNLSWTGSTDLPNPGGSGVKGYNIYRGNSNTPLNGSTLVSGTSYSDTTVSASTQYTYEVEAVDKVGNVSAPTNVASATTPAPTCSGTPSQPSTLTAGATTINSVIFNWTKSTASAGCTLNGYHIYQVNGSTYTLVNTVTSGSGTIISASISGLTPNTSYTYAVEAFDTSGHTSDKTQAATHITIATLADTVPPTPPTSLSATAASSTQVNLTWPAGSDNVGVTTYKVYRSDKGAVAITTINNATGATSYSYTDSSASPSTTYTYQVSALDAAGNESTKTTSSAVSTLAATGTSPSAPRSPAAPIVASQSAHLTWTAPATGTVTGYHVYIDGVLDTSPNDSFTSNGGTLSCLAPAIANPPYVVTVKAFNSAGEGPAATVSVTTPSGGLAGDFNCNSQVDGFDLNALATNWLMTQMLPTAGDANGDTTVNGFDLNALATNWGKSL